MEYSIKHGPRCDWLLAQQFSQRCLLNFISISFLGAFWNECFKNWHRVLDIFVLYCVKFCKNTLTTNHRTDDQSPNPCRWDCLINFWRKTDFEWIPSQKNFGYISTIFMQMYILLTSKLSKGLLIFNLHHGVMKKIEFLAENGFFL